MADETAIATIASGDDPALLPVPGGVLPLLPGELRPHPSPFQYVMIAVILCVITALEVGMYFLVDDIPRALYIIILLTMAFTKFVTVLSWFMHLRTDRPIFRRLFVTGSIGAILLYTIVLSTLHVYE